MAGEYEPLTDPEAVTRKLRDTVEQYDPQARISRELAPTEIPDQVLFEGIVDIMSSRGGERWKKLDEIVLEIDRQTDLFVGFYDADEQTSYQTAWLNIERDDEPHEDFEIRKSSSNTQLYKEYHPTNEQTLPIPTNDTGLRLRLLKLLLDGHTYTPLEEFTDEDYAP